MIREDATEFTFLYNSEGIPHYDDRGPNLAIQAVGLGSFCAESRERPPRQAIRVKTTLYMVSSNRR